MHEGQIAIHSMMEIWMELYGIQHAQTDTHTHKCTHSSITSNKRGAKKNKMKIKQRQMKKNGVFEKRQRKQNKTKQKTE